MDVTILTGADRACDAFVASMPAGNIAHLPAWNTMVEKSMGLRSIYLVARHEGKVAGVLPLTHLKSFLFGNQLISGSLANYGGPLAGDPPALEALFNKAVAIATDLGCESIEFRNLDAMPFDLQAREGKVCMLLPLTADPEVLWKGFDPKVRNQVRKAEKSEIVVADGGPELVDEFYEVYTIRMHELGTPCYSRKVIYEMARTFPQHSRIFIARLKETVVGAGITTCFNGLAEIPLAATRTEYNKLCPNNLLYWTAIKHYCLAGAKNFDFGRSSKDSGTYQFKKQWGPQPVELHYQYWVRPGHTLSVTSPDNPKYQREIELWKKLPLWLTRVLGPIVSRGLP